MMPKLNLRDINKMPGRNKKLKSSLIILSIIVVILLIILGIIIYKFDKDTSPCIPNMPSRIGQVPQEARWVGGCDGGHWFDIVELEPDSNRYKIGLYYDYNGELITETYFSLNSSCPKKYFYKDELFRMILDYDYFEIHLKESRCTLAPIDNKIQ